MFGTLKLKWQLLIGFSIPIILIISIAALVYDSLEDLLISNKWVNHTYEAIDLGKSIGTSLVDMETGLRGYLVSGKDEFLEPYDAGLIRFQNLIKQTKNKVSDNQRQVGRLMEVEKLEQEWQAEHIEIAFKLRREVTAGAEAANYFNQVSARTVGKDMFDGFRANHAQVEAFFVQQNDPQGILLMKLILIDMINQETGQRGFLLTGKEESLEPFVAGSASFETNFKALEAKIGQLSGNIEISQQVKQLGERARGWKSGAAEPEINARREMNQVTTTMNDVTAFIEKGIGKGKMDKMRELLSAFVDEEAALIIERNAEQISIAQNTENITLIGALIALIAGILVTLIITRIVMRQLGEEPSVLRSISDNIANGNLDMHMDENRSDGVLKSMAVMRNNLHQRQESDQQMQQEIDHLVTYAVKGDFSKVINTQGKEGVFLNVSTGLNNLVNTCNDGLSDTNRVLAAVSRGDLSQSIDGHYQGAFLELKNSCNNTVRQLSTVMVEIGQLIESANDGDFKSQINMNDKSGFFAELSQNLNTLVQTTDNSLEDILRILSALQAGDLSQSITANYSGAFAQLKDYSNDTVSKMNTVIGEIEDLVNAANRGEFNTRISLDGKAGFFASLSGNLNELVNTTNGGLNDVLRVLEALAQGDLSQTIDASYEGSFKQLKEYSNHTVGQISNVMGEIGSMINAANNGDFSGRIDVSNKGGFFQELSRNLNIMMDTTDNGLRDMLQILEALAKGDLNKSSDMEADGPFKQLKNYSDDTIRNMNNVMSEIASVITAANAGDFKTNIKLSGKTGFYYELSEGLNNLVATTDAGLEDITRVLGGLAEGEIGNRIDNDLTGSFGELRDHANATADKLTEVIEQITSSSDIVSSGATELAQGNLDLSRRTEDQVAVLEETSTSMEEMTSAVSHNAKNAEHANQMSKNAQKIAEGGGTVVQDAVLGMTEISTASNKIADIIGVIDEIAFQTNLLALNAAVEAARAGEQGKGFAVVATEVRNLAQRSASAAKEIKELIIESVERVEEGSTLVNKCGSTLTEIVDAVKNVGDMIERISSASNEQAAGIETVNKAVAEMEQMAQQNAALVEETSAAGQNMSQQADDMKELLQFFKMSA